MKKSLSLLTGLSMISGLLPLAQPVYAADREPFTDVASAPYTAWATAADGTRPFDDQLSPVQVKDPSDPTGFLTRVPSSTGCTLVTLR